VEYYLNAMTTTTVSTTTTTATTTEAALDNATTPDYDYYDYGGPVDQPVDMLHVIMGGQPSLTVAVFSERSFLASWQGFVLTEDKHEYWTLKHSVVDKTKVNIIASPKCKKCEVFRLRTSFIAWRLQITTKTLVCTNVW